MTTEYKNSDWDSVHMLLHHVITLCGREVKKRRVKIIIIIIIKIKGFFFFFSNSTAEIKSEFYNFWSKPFICYCNVQYLGLLKGAIAHWISIPKLLSHFLCSILCSTIQDMSYVWFFFHFKLWLFYKESETNIWQVRIDRI